MKRICLGIGSWIFFLSVQIIMGQISIPAAGLQAISSQEMLVHVQYLASDEMLGRDTPSPQLDSCGAFIARYFRSLGLAHAGSLADYFQSVPLLKTRIGGSQKFVVTVNGVAKEYALKDDFIPLPISANREVTAPVVFVGYSISAPDYRYDDYQGIDVRGKVVLAFTHEPQERDSSSIFQGAKMTEHSELHNKVLNAIDHGAVGFIYVTDPVHKFRRPPNIWPSLMKTPPEEAIPFTLGEKEENKIVAVRIGKQLADDLMAMAGKSMEAVHHTIDTTLKPQSFDLPSVTVTIATDLASDRFLTQNVVAWWPGCDSELKNEFVVIGAHYDHLGARGDSVIYHGADDNASGTAGVMAVAKAFSHCSQRPLRSIVFMCFTGEEKGLFGSRYYAGTDPLFPLEKTVAMLNMDMIGRNDTSAVEVFGANRSPELAAILKEVNASLKLKLDLKEDRRVGGSDHASFFRKKIPYLFFNTGTHEDYHRTSDTPEKLNAEKMAQIARLAFGCAWQIANMKERPAPLNTN